MTFLAFLELAVGICLVSDGAFSRGLLINVIPRLSTAAIVCIRLTEVVTGGVIFILLGLTLSTC